MKLEQKKELVKQLKEDFKKARSVVFIDFTGLGAKDLNLLRNKMREAGGEVQVAKDTLIRLALDQSKKQRENGNLEGPTAIVFVFSESLSPIRALVNFREEFEIPEIKGGFFEGNRVSAEEVFELSRIPGRKELLAQVAAFLNLPLQRLALVAKSPVRRLITIVDVLSNRE